MKAKITYLFLAVTFMGVNGLQAQWINFIDQTEDRIVVTNINDNDNAAAVDDMEKDFVVGDYNMDGFDDLIVVRKAPFSFAGARTDVLLLNNGEGALVDVTDIYAPIFLTDPTDARDAIKLDANGDGWMDVFIVNTFQDQPKLFINMGEDTNGDWLGFADESSRLPILTQSFLQFCAASAGDLTGNGAMDIYMVNYSQTQQVEDVFFINDGTGNFTEEAEARIGNLRNSSFGTATELHDIDNDGDLDIIKCLGAGGGGVPPFGDQGLYAYFNDGTGNFSDFIQYPGLQPYMFTGSDLNNDGDLDFYVVDDQQDYVNSTTNFQADVNVNYDQNFLTSDRTDVWGGNVKMVDIDGDGDPDVTIASVDTDEPPCDTSIDTGQSGGIRVFTIFENEGAFSGDIVDPYAGTTQPWNISNYDQDFIDLNNDGALDLIIGACEGYVIFMQETATLSAEDIVLSGLINVFPNPTKGIVNITLDDTFINDVVEITLYDIRGKKLTSIDTENGISNQNILFDVQPFTTTGIYFLNISTSTGTFTQKLIVE